MWKQIEGFPDYEVSEEGQIRSNRVPIDGRKNRFQPGHLLSLGTMRHGYKTVVLYLPGSTKRHTRTVHRLVALAFIPNPEKLSDVAHRDGDPTNNRKDNLRWATHADNQMDMRKHGTMQDGEKSCTAKLTADQVDEIRLRAAQLGRGAGIALAKEYGVSPAQISRVIRRRRWGHQA